MGAPARTHQQKASPALEVQCHRSRIRPPGVPNLKKQASLEVGPRPCRNPTARLSKAASSILLRSLQPSASSNSILLKVRHFAGLDVVMARNSVPRVLDRVFHAVPRATSALPPLELVP